MKVTYPSEAYEGELFAEWLRANNYMFSHLAQNTFTRSHAVKAKLKRAGVNPGVPDYIICLKNKPLLCFIELKRVKGGRVSKEQSEWIRAINRTDALAQVCYGFAEARDAVEKEDS